MTKTILVTTIQLMTNYVYQSKMSILSIFLKTTNHDEYIISNPNNLCNINDNENSISKKVIFIIQH
jgi:hypothetical protein